MEEEKKKRKKTGGRAKGTPNKTTSFQRGIINNLLSEYSEQGMLAEDFVALDPAERIKIAEKLMAYVIPRYQSVSVDVSEVSVKHSIEEDLLRLSKACE